MKTKNERLKFFFDTLGINQEKFPKVNKIWMLADEGNMLIGDTAVGDNNNGNVSSNSPNSNNNTSTTIEKQYINNGGMFDNLLKAYFENELTEKQLIEKLKAIKQLLKTE